MKKSLVLAMAMALGVTASAYAANPFSDVPAGHWAYDSLAKLADTGVIDGYPDGTFKGDETITRYEAAQITARAMAKGANVDKLAAEFASELEALGVKVAALEKNSDNVKITGQLRYRYATGRKSVASVYDHSVRTRLFLQGQVNDDWKYTAMLQNTQDLQDNVGNEGINFRRAYLEGKVGGLAVTAGRWNECTSTANVFDAFVDGVKLSYGKKVKVTVQALKGTDGDIAYHTMGEGDDKVVIPVDRVYVASVDAKLGVFDSYFNYFKAQGKEDGRQIYNVGTSLPVAKNVTLAAEYMWSDKKIVEEVSKDGWVATVNYKGADTSKPGSYGLHVGYYDQPINAVLAPTTEEVMVNFVDKTNAGYKGWNIGGAVALAKNIELDVNYYAFEAKKGEKKNDAVYTELFFFF